MHGRTRREGYGVRSGTKTGMFVFYPFPRRDGRVTLRARVCLALMISTTKTTQ